MKKKVFMYSTSVLLLIILITLIISLMILLGVFPNYLYVFIPLIIVFLACFWYLFAVGVFTPIHVNNIGIKYRGKLLRWEKAKITVCPIMTRSWRYGYYLIISDHFILGNEFKKEMKNQACIYLRKSILPVILPFYKSRVMILDLHHNFCEKLNSSNDINEIIESHNLKFDN